MTITINFPAVEGERLLTVDDNVACQSFALCTNAAEGAYSHPILGAVLSCAPCASLLDQDFEPVSVV